MIRSTPQWLRLRQLLDEKRIGELRSVAGFFSYFNADPANIRKAKKAIRTAFEAQVHGLGFSMVELLSTCPTNWGITPVESLKWLEEHMIPVYPLVDCKVSSAVGDMRF